VTTLKKGAGLDSDPEFGRELTGRVLPKREKREVDVSTLPSRSPDVETDNPVFVPPWLGSRVVKGISIDEIASYLNETALFRNQWQFRPESGERGVENDEAFKARIRPTLREQLA